MAPEFANGTIPSSLCAGPAATRQPMTKRALSETEICDRFITPALQQAGWLLERMRREYSFTDGRIIVRGRLVSRGRRKRADYLLVYEGVPLMVVSMCRYG